LSIVVGIVLFSNFSVYIFSTISDFKLFENDNNYYLRFSLDFCLKNYTLLLFIID